MGRVQAAELTDAWLQRNHYRTPRKGESHPPLCPSDPRRGRCVSFEHSGDNVRLCRPRDVVAAKDGRIEYTRVDIAPDAQSLYAV